MDTEIKLTELGKTFPNYDREALLDILIMCGGSIDSVISLLDENNDTKNFNNESQIDKLDYDTDKLQEGTKSRFFKNKTFTFNNAITEDKRVSGIYENEYDEKLPNEKSPICNVSIDQLPQRASPEKLTTHIKKETLIEKPIQDVSFLSKTRNIASLIGPKRKIGNSEDGPRKKYNLDTIKTNRTITLHSKLEIEAALPNIRIFKNFLRSDLADEILETLESQKMLFKAKQFYIAGQLCKSSQKSIVYSLGGHFDYDPVYSTPKSVEHHAPPSLTKGLAFIEAKVNEVLHDLYADDLDTPEYMIKKNWKADFCVGNSYPNNKSHLDWHSDKLTNIGPLATIASISFGSTRIFRLRRSFPTNSIIYNIPLPHNTLLIMLPSTQELFKHCVPTLTDSLISKSADVGETRYNLTFRMMSDASRSNKFVTCDKCNQRMILRRLFKGKDIGYYVWMCMASFKGATCNGFKYADFKVQPDGTTNLSTIIKSEATRWLCPSEIIN